MSVFGAGLRPWKRQTETKRAADSSVPGKGELVVSDTGKVYAGDGATQAKNLSPMLRKTDADATYATVWQPSTVYAAGALAMLPAPINGPGTRTTAGTSRLAFDATEQALWTPTGGGLAKPTGTMQTSKLFGSDSTDPSKTVQVDMVEITKADIGLGYVDNTSDADKPVSTAQAAAIAAKRAGGPNPVAGRYVVPCGPNTASTNGALGNGTLRVAPFLVDKPLSIDRLGFEITVAGQSGSHFRPGIYADNGNGHPGALVLDGGQGAADAVAGVTVTATATLPPGLYWIGGAVQDADTTQPTMRVTGAGWIPPILLDLGKSAPSNGITYIGHSMTGVTGALPSTFSTTVTGQITMPRIWMRTA
ncbi:MULTISPECIES: hypothetical protein [Gordonia]|uniref:hypothetical protein n=1 Tax=Gordonia TaxID=2053 RepID=UPI00257F4CF4|nr:MULTISPECIES: hypothetical protein [Gordonia]